ncbi:MAG: CHASE4 domain-containing protein [Candidatus Dojkabacteria bacterium]|uniref:HAMP domain-containing protein n=1 Tax=Candidatus Dojkabacteria bacterium TaxID=2099670 RepID=A0A952DSB0_9BACT|nr:hypothetical protein [Candidatus Dojkabacteria bacterium]WKZ27703.1 MAG: CHASE4 domain-containing protein [Candidatus Dojkabacteria bacterium]
MSISTKSIILVFVSLLLLVLFNLSFSRAYILSGFEEAENRHISSSMNLVLNTLRTKVTNSLITSRDYAAWDDTYNYLLGNYPTFFESNFTANTLDNLGLSFLAILDDEDNVVDSVFLDDEANLLQPAPDRWLEFILSNPKLLALPDDVSQHGDLQESEFGPVIITVTAVNNSELTAESPGKLVMVELLDQSKLDQLGEQLLFPVKITQSQVDQNALADDAIIAIHKLSEDQEIIVDHTNSVHYAYSFYYSQYSNSKLLIQIECTHGIFAQGEDVLNYYLLLIIVGGIVTLIILYTGMTTFLLRPLGKLNSQLDNIILSSNFTLRTEINKAGEISSLSDRINRLLDSVNRSEATMIKQQELVEQRNKELAALNQEMLETNKMMIGRELQMAELKKQIAKEE